MRFFFLLVIFFSFAIHAADVVPPYVSAFDAKVYSLKTKGVKDFTVKIVSPKLTRQMNEQMIFGTVNEVSFTVYWTANPERYAIEVNGLPEGFKEIKEELKQTINPMMDNLIPQTTAQRFAGYKITQGNFSRDYNITDTSGLAAIPSYTLKFDVSDRPAEIIGKKTIGTLTIVPKYEKTNFSDGKWVLQSLVSTNSENGQTVVSRKELTYGTASGIGVVSKVTLTTEQTSAAKDAKPLILEDEIVFKDYKINNGDALKYFLSGDSAGEAQTSP